MEASLRKPSALRLRFSQSLASRRQRLSQAMERSTIQRLGVSVRSGRGMGAVKRISYVEARPHKVLSFCW